MGPWQHRLPPTVPGAPLRQLHGQEAAQQEFIIIVLGETLTGVVGGLASQPVSALTMAVGLVADSPAHPRS